MGKGALKPDNLLQDRYPDNLTVAYLRKQGEQKIWQTLLKDRVGQMHAS